MEVKNGNQQWYQKTVAETLATLNTTKEGLNATEVSERFKKYGPNSLPLPRVTSWWRLWWRQFTSPLIYILLVASVIVALIGSPQDAIVIIAVLLINAVIGLFQEGRAEKAILELRDFAKTEGSVIRSGKELVVSDEQIVPGDIIVVRAGDKIPADARIIEAQRARTDEAALTGESTPVSKFSEVVDDGRTLPTGDQRNMLFKGTYLSTGVVSAVVVATGDQTILGNISDKLSTIESDIPLKKNIKTLSRVIAVGVLVVSSLVFGLGLWQGIGIYDMFFTAVAIAVSLVPEGLPLSITLVLTAGVYRMSKHQALVKKIQAVEALGQATIIAVDKTGTITKNELMVEYVYVAGKRYSVNGSGYEVIGEIFDQDKKIDPAGNSDLLLMGKVASFCADAEVSFVENENRFNISGDPTEAALLIFGEKIGFNKHRLENQSPQIFEIPFDTGIKFHTTIHKTESSNYLTVVGAPEAIWPYITDYHQSADNPKAVLTEEARRDFENEIAELSAQGLRVLVAAVNELVLDTITLDKMPKLKLLGIYAMRDSLREGVDLAVKQAIERGVKVVMITGDHVSTAQALATKAGIYQLGDSVLSGVELDRLDKKQLAEILPKVSVFARVSPEHKLRIISLLKGQGHIVAMTGDGVNDALSLVEADLGIAMGNIGTDVAKASADIVLLDDNFKSIVAAIEEGRSVYKTVRKVVLYLLSTGMGELLAILGTLVVGLSLPLLPVHILWLNLITDGFLVIGLALEPKVASLGGPMKMPRLFVDGLMFKRIIIMGAVMMVGTMALFWYWHDIDLIKAWTVSLTVLAVFQWFNAFNCRRIYKSITDRTVPTNYYLWLGLSISVVAHLLIIYVPVLQRFMRTSALGLSDWLIIIIVASSVMVVEEGRKFLSRRS